MNNKFYDALAIIQRIILPIIILFINALSVYVGTSIWIAYLLLVLPILDVALGFILILEFDDDLYQKRIEAYIKGSK